MNLSGECIVIISLLWGISFLLVSLNVLRLLIMMGHLRSLVSRWLVALSVATLITAGVLKLQDVVPMEPETLAPCFTAPRGGPQKLSDIRGSSHTRCQQRAAHRSEVLVTSASVKLVEATGMSNPGRELIAHIHKGN